MNLRNYLVLSSLMFVNLFIFIFVVFGITEKNYFLAGLLSLTILLVIGITTAYSIYHEKRYAYTTSALFFALSLVETAILYFAITSYLIIILVLISVLGFIISIDNFVFSRSKKIQKPKATLTKWVEAEDKKEKTQAQPKTYLLKQIDEFEKEVEQKEALKKEIPALTPVKKPKKEPRIIFKDEQEDMENELDRIQKLFEPYFDELQKKEAQKTKSTGIEKPAEKLSEHEWAEKEWADLRKKFMHLPEKEPIKATKESADEAGRYYDEEDLQKDIKEAEGKKIIKIRPVKIIQVKQKRRELKAKKKTKLKKPSLPGKYIASEFGKAYHLPKCDFAKKIPRANRIWFKTAKTAEREGYEKHNCVK